ncbi:MULTISPECIES: hypothetical protein [unclassified Shewanella]|uniref:hypothetical protein n=1 Tax=unclassified Shewanella TaxID=196818 RepID=UPI0007EED0F8|nr:MULTISPECIES: hypothetical protein [unclassified Shewanella]OBT07008.1 hypothetical protein A9267_14130 [Shewanella sp. UCD-FRSSP16_17]
MNNFVWNDFGTLANVSKTDSMIYIENTSGDVRKMSIRSYQVSAMSVYEKALMLKGRKVRIRTSQNTDNWNTNEWFSEIVLIDNEHSSDFLSVGESEPKPDKPF